MSAKPRKPLQRKTPLRRGKPPNRKNTRPKKASRKTNRTERADKLFSLRIRARDGVCQAGDTENCSGTKMLQCAHGFSRRYRAVRWDDRNAWALCRGCHTYYTHRPLEWDEWLRDRWGEELYGEIRELALCGRPPDLDEVIEREKAWAN